MSVSAANEFRGTAPVGSGTNNVTVAATDASGNVATQQYEITNSAAAKTFIYDANGNLTNDGTRTFEWDSENRLVAVLLAEVRLDFAYDGRGRRRTISKHTNGILTERREFVWCEMAICQERSGAGQILRNFYQDAVDDQLPKMLSRDHLASTREITNNDGTVAARYEYDPLVDPPR